MSRTSMLLTLAIVVLATSGCGRTCRNFFRRGAPCGTTTVAPPMMGAPKPLGRPFLAQPPAPSAVVPGMVVQPAQVPQCCEPCCEPCPVPCCPQPCLPCAPDNCGCDTGEVVGEGEWFGGYVEGATESYVVPQDAGKSSASTYRDDPRPVGEK